MFLSATEICLVRRLIGIIRGDIIAPPVIEPPPVGGEGEVAVSGDIAAFEEDGVTYSWIVTGSPDQVPSTGGVMVSVTNGFATLTGGGLNHTFVVFGSPGTSPIGPFNPSVSGGVASFVLSGNTYSFIVTGS